VLASQLTEPGGRGGAAEHSVGGARQATARASCCISFHQSRKYSSMSFGPHAQSDAATTLKLSTRVSGALAVRACIRTAAESASRIASCDRPTGGRAGGGLRAAAPSRAGTGQLAAPSRSTLAAHCTAQP
jgi:hypothetical protein